MSPPITLACTFCTAALGSALGVPCARAEVTTGTDAEAGLPYWELRESGMSVRLVQRLPDQTRGFFLARGFSREDVELVAQSCVFQTIFRNTSQTTTPDALEYDLRDWRVQAAKESQGMKTREDWAGIWAARGIARPARIAFEWALFPTRQVYQPGDYNWGMSVFGLAPDSRFDLTLTWTQFGARHTAVIPSMHCAADAPPAPEVP